jgi:hypothetical protein
MIKALEAGIRGLMTAQDSLAQNAEKSAKLGIGEDDIVTPKVGMMQDSVQFKASATVIREADKMQQAVLDILA